MTFYDPDSQRFKAALVVWGQRPFKAVCCVGLGWDVWIFWDVWTDKCTELQTQRAL